MIQKPDIIDVVEAEGIELRRRGTRWWTCCPFHADKTPSFCVDEKRQTWRCFGACSTGGDVISFIERLHGLDFKAACRHLGMTSGTAPSRAERHERERRRELVEDFRAWERDYHTLLCHLWRALQWVKELVKTEDELDRVAHLYHRESLRLSRLEILESDDDEAKLELFAEVSRG